MGTVDIWEMVLKKEFGSNINVDAMLMAMSNYTQNMGPACFPVLLKMERDPSLDLQGKLIMACALGMLTGIHVGRMAEGKK